MCDGLPQPLVPSPVPGVDPVWWKVRDCQTGRLAFVECRHWFEARDRGERKLRALRHVLDVSRSSCWERAMKESWAQP